MSVINQVLNQLEQRGAHAAPEQTMVRPVPHSKRRFAIPMPLLSSGLALGLALAGGIAAWQWMQMRKPVLSSVEGPKVVAASVVQLQPTVAIPATVSAVPASAVAAASAISAVSTGETPPAEMLPPAASRLSFELNSIPLPSARKDEEHPANAAPPARSDKPQPTQTASPNVRAAVPPSAGVSPMKQVSPMQHADAE
ncbi:MAG TPA: hypothetical protein VFQ99_06305, partial [Gallionella sp.]|nr:hypothetical protein [Gallionella sp.]